MHWGSAPCDASAWVYSQDDKVAGARLDGLERRLQRLRAEQSELTERWESERALMDSLQSVKEEIDRCFVKDSCALGQADVVGPRMS